MRKLIFSFLNKTESTIFGPKYLLLTNTVSSGLLMFIGEIVAQRLDKKKIQNSEGGKIQYDKEKIKQLTVVGISQGPLHHYVYEWMERSLPGNAQRTVLKKILCDQLIVSPVFITHYFYTAFFLGGKQLSETTRMLFEENIFWRVYLVDWMVWPVAQWINFKYLPIRFRVLYINAITMFYNVFLCYVKNNRDEKPSIK